LPSDLEGEKASFPNDFEEYTYPKLDRNSFDSI
jgi:hypothetical protein